ncbi:MarR family winged helix-turn-helix transcriptional regulator [Streptococcus castoreus]|uniref:MarR family winged helix-turn-helix transcriptional regulator n=1 Tax=Streptococcus castoreus TaxID=254786 RepID=UPI000488220C|nr:MarR family transcriptional regulator [Streptococcus castoreus]
MNIEGGYLVSRIKYLSARKLNKLFLEYGLSEFNGEQGKILYFLWRKEGISSTDISISTGLAINTLTVMLDKMETAGLIYRRQSEMDKRKKAIFLTQKGKDLEDKSKLATDEMNQIFYKGFSKDEIQMFEKNLMKIVLNLEEK